MIREYAILVVPTAAFAIAILFVAIGSWARRRWLIVTVRGSSMAPTLRDGQRLLARRLRPPGAHLVRTGTVVVFALPEQQRAQLGPGGMGYLVKRIAAVGGEPVPGFARAALGADSRSIVPAGRVVIAGDAAESQDSRQLGYVDIRSIVAVVPGLAPAGHATSSSAGASTRAS